MSAICLSIIKYICEYNIVHYEKNFKEKKKTKCAENNTHEILATKLYNIDRQLDLFSSYLTNEA